MDDRTRMQAVISASLGNPERDFPEDYGHENGQYQNRCCVCNNLFLGYKRRVVCKKCLLEAATQQVEKAAPADP